MADSEIPPVFDNGNVNVGALWSVLWRDKWLIILVVCIFAVFSVVAALSLDNYYRAEARVYPSDANGVSGLSQLSGSLGGLAGLAGVDLQGGAGSQKALGLEILRSRQFLANFIRERGLLVEVMAAESWSFEKDKLLLDDSIYDSSNSTWVREVAPPRQAQPSYAEAAEYFRDELLAVTESRNDEFVTISITHVSPTLAAEWVSWLIKDLNQEVMRKDVAEARAAIAYLEEQVASTSLSEMQDVFFRLIEEHTKTILLAQVSDEYLFDTIDPAIIPEEKSGPARALMVVAGSFAGAVLGVLFVLVRQQRTAGRKHD